MPRVLLLVLSTVLTAAVVGVGVLRSPPPGPRPVAAAPPTAAVQPEPAVGALAVLRAWDERRAAAWAAGDAAALAGLYVAGSAAGAADVRMLRRWAARGLRVRGLAVQVLRVRVRSADPDRLVLVVTDRLAGARAVGAVTDVILPTDGPTTRTVVLERSAAGWRVAEVR